MLGTISVKLLARPWFSGACRGEWRGSLLAMWPRTTPSPLCAAVDYNHARPACFCVLNPTDVSCQEITHYIAIEAQVYLMSDPSTGVP